ncbi:phage integrase [Roseovarius sp. TM1035]|nr:phage integrase [Roseovarius sp. TM1035]
MVNRSGRYHARLVVPKDLRGIIGKTELRTPLGGDYRQALKLLPGAVAQLQHQIGLAEQKAGAGRPQTGPARYPLAPDQIAHSLYMQRLAFDDVLRNDPRYPAIGIDDRLVQRLRAAISGSADDAELADLVGAQIDRFRAAGNLDAKPGSTEWRVIARAVCSAELEALARVAERDEGDFTGTPTAPIIVNAQPPQDQPVPVSLKRLWADYVQMRMQSGSMRDGGKRQGAVIENLRKFVKHDDAARLTKKDIMAWRDHLRTSLAAKTISDVHLSTVRSLLNWAVENDRLPENVAVTVKQAKSRKTYGRERGYTDAEAVKILKASRSYVRTADASGYIRESEKSANLKRWVPIISAFSGARVSEITQLRKEDIRKEGDQWIIRITPDAGTVKAGDYRDVPLHPQIIAEGFPHFVQDAKPGPLFHSATDPKKFKGAAAIVSSRLAQWLSHSGVKPEGLQPNHAWRHRFKSQCIELGISPRIYDAIQGHAGKTASDGYGDVSLKAKIDAIGKLPTYAL